MAENGHKVQYSEAVASEICRRLSVGQSLAAISARADMPCAGTIRRWRSRRKDFAARYAAACPRKRRRRLPVTMTGSLFAEICSRLGNGEFLTAICRDDHMPCRGQVHRRVRADAALRARYDEARALQVEHLFEEIVTIADEDDNPARARLRIEARKWLVLKLAPGRYGDRADDAAEGATTLAERLDKARERIAHDD